MKVMRGYYHKPSLQILAMSWLLKLDDMYDNIIIEGEILIPLISIARGKQVDAKTVAINTLMRLVMNESNHGTFKADMWLYETFKDLAQEIRDDEHTTSDQKNTASKLLAALSKIEF